MRLSLCGISIVIWAKKWNLVRSVCNDKIELTEQKIHKQSLQNHRTAEFGRDHWSSSGPMPLLKQGHPGCPGPCCPIPLGGNRGR